MSNDQRDPLRVLVFSTSLNWWWCHPDELFLEVEGAPPSPSRL